jgi:hypothetical protein
VVPENEGGEIQRLLKGGRPGKPIVPAEAIQFELQRMSCRVFLTPPASLLPPDAFMAGRLLSRFAALRLRQFPEAHQPHFFTYQAVTNPQSPRNKYPTATIPPALDPAE